MVQNQRLYMRLLKIHFQAKLQDVSAKHAKWIDRIIARDYSLRISQIAAWKNYAVYLALKFVKVGADYYVKFVFEVEKEEEII